MIAPLALALLLSPSFNEHDGLHRCICVVGDVSGDGVADFAVASRYTRKEGTEFVEPILPERVWLISGANGRTLRELRGVTPGDGFGRALVGTDDLDGDGWPELLLSGRSNAEGEPQGYVQVVSARKGTVLRTLTTERKQLEFGFDVAAGTDLDGDGVGDLLIGAPAAPGHMGGGVVFLISGASGKVLREIEGEPGKKAKSKPHGIGTGVAFGPDLNGDGLAEILAGDCWRESDNGFTVGAIDVHSGRDGALLSSIAGHPGNGTGVGWALASLGDFDGDGHDDFASSGIESCLHVVSGWGMEPLYHVDLFHGVPDCTGTSIDRVGDLDGDGCADLFLGSNAAGHVFFDPARAQVFSGRTRELLFSTPYETSREEGNGFDVCGPGDLDGDGIPDLAWVEVPAGVLTVASGAHFKPFFVVQLGASAPAPPEEW